MFALTFAVAVTAVPWYAFAHGYHIAAWAAFTVFLGANGPVGPRIPDIL